MPDLFGFSKRQNSFVEINLLSTRKKNQQSKRLLSQSDDFDQDVFIGDTVSSGRQDSVLHNRQSDWELTINNNNSPSIANENAMDVQMLEKNITDGITREKSNVVETVEGMIQNAILSAMDNNITVRIELALRSMNASSGRDVASVTANSERGEQVRVCAFYKIVPESNSSFRQLSLTDETGRCSPDEVYNLHTSL